MYCIYKVNLLCPDTNTNILPPEIIEYEILLFEYTTIEFIFMEY